MIPTTHMHEQEPSFPPPGWAGNLYCMHACNFSLYFFLYLIVSFHSEVAPKDAATEKAVNVVEAL